MRPSGGLIERLADGELPPAMVLLVAMLENQIDDLAKLHAAGLWVSSPQEIGANIRGCGRKSGSYEAHMAMDEWLLWPRTDDLVEALERYTPIRIDRGRIVALALKRSESLRRDGRSSRWRGNTLPLAGRKGVAA